MLKSRTDLTPASVPALLEWFERSAYVRLCDLERRRRDGQAYKKGSEVRFVLASQVEVRAVRRLLHAVGLRPGKPFLKNNRIVQPVYGEPAVEWFLSRLPIGRDRATLGFSSCGQRTVRRSYTGTRGGN